jgi:hypothetical protein
MSKNPRKEDAIDLLLRAMATGNSSDAILQQEADGQSSFTKSETLPSDMSEEARKALEKSGVKFLGIVEDDPVFQYVELPEGWKKTPTSHSMWSDLVDANGKKRADIFYKAAFYDRSANLSIVRRFNIQIDYEHLREEDLAQAKVFDNNEEIFSSESVPFPVPYKDVSDPQKRYEAEDEAKAKAFKEAEEWLEEKYPEWKDPSMYWND